MKTTHVQHIAIQAALQPSDESTTAFMKRIAGYYGVSSSRIYELRSGNNLPLCCSGGLVAPKVKKLFIAAPTSDLPIVAFRMWNYVGGSESRLRSYNSHLGTWKPNEKFTAHCVNGRHNRSEIPAAVDCCGVHAYKKLDAADLLARQADGILGVVMLFGGVMEHEIGYRAQYAKIVALTVKPTTDDVSDALRSERTEIISKEYGVPVIPFEHINDYISEFGQVLPTCTATGRRKRG